MPPRYVAPAIDLTAFSCQHCGVLTTQYWFIAMANNTQNFKAPELINEAKLDELKKRRNTITANEGDDVVESLITRWEKQIAGIAYGLLAET